MPQSALMSFVVAIISLMAAALLLRHLRAFVDALLHRQPDETWTQAFKRGYAEHQLNKLARWQMFGGRRTTAFASVGTLLLTIFVWVWVGEGRVLGYVLGAYVLAGLIVNRNMAVSQRPEWPRLGFGDKMLFRLAHAWVWPMHWLTARR